MDFAYALGFPSADHFLASISVSQWMEWLEWVSIRGPIGPVRDDYWGTVLAMYAGGPYPDPRKIKLADFQPPWLRFPGASLDEHIRPWSKPPK